MRASHHREVGPEKLPRFSAMASPSCQAVDSRSMSCRPCHTSFELSPDPWRPVPTPGTPRKPDSRLLSPTAVPDRDPEHPVQRSADNRTWDADRIGGSTQRQPPNAREPNDSPAPSGGRPRVAGGRKSSPLRSWPAGLARPLEDGEKRSLRASKHFKPRPCPAQPPTQKGSRDQTKQQEKDRATRQPPTRRRP
jgi:hypothetical protein